MMMVMSLSFIKRKLTGLAVFFSSLRSLFFKTSWLDSVFLLLPSVSFYFVLSTRFLCLFVSFFLSFFLSLWLQLKNSFVIVKRKKGNSSERVKTFFFLLENFLPFVCLSALSWAKNFLMFYHLNLLIQSKSWILLFFSLTSFPSFRIKRIFSSCIWAISMQQDKKMSVECLHVISISSDAFVEIAVLCVEEHSIAFAISWRFVYAMTCLAMRRSGPNS